MKLSRDEVVHIAAIARLGMSEVEIETAREQLSNILENFAVLNGIDTKDVPPTAQSIHLVNVLRADVPRESLTVEQVLANAPATEGDLIKLRPVLE